MRRTVVLGALIAIGALSVGIAGQQQRAVLPDLEKVKDNFYIIGASSPVDRGQFTGGNVGVFVTDGGVIVVDTKLAGYGPDIIAKIKAVTSKPITTIINTHTHGDHTGSNEFFPASVEVVAQENTKANMEKMDAFKGDKAQFLPDKTFKDKLTLFSGADQIDLYYFGAGHTNGDAVVVFKALRVAHIGDLFARKGTPLIDLNNGGSGVAYPNTVKNAAKKVKGVDQVITGHSDVFPWSAVSEYAEFNKAFLDATTASMKSGKSADDTIAAFKMPDKFKEYNMSGVKDNVTKIYAELKK